MAYDGKLLARARARLEEEKADREAGRRRRVEQVYREVPEIGEIDGRLRAQMARLVRLTVSRGPNLQGQIAALKEENLDLQVRRAELLVAHGWPPEYLDEQIACPKCRDTGVYQGRPCVCLERLYNQELTKELGVLMRNGDESFERFDLGLYSDRTDPALGASPREAMSVVYDACKKFAENFPRVSSNLLLQGGTGLGKTYLSACIARTVAAKGFSVCYDTAASALDAFERQKFLRDSEERTEASVRAGRMLSCDLMILDDLGTEMPSPSSGSALYTLLNTRLINSRRTVISTNLSGEELARRYSGQICSRLEGEFLHLRFVGEDIRLKKR